MPIQNEKLQKFAARYQEVLGDFSDDEAVMKCIREVCADSLLFATQHGLQNIDEILVAAARLQHIKISSNQESTQNSSVN
jgi:hypothetical protein